MIFSNETRELEKTNAGRSNGQGAHQKEMQVGVWCVSHGYGRLPKAIVHQNTSSYLLTLVCLQHWLGRKDEKGDREEEQQLQGEAQSKLTRAG